MLRSLYLVCSAVVAVPALISFGCSGERADHGGGRPTGADAGGAGGTTGPAGTGGSGPGDGGSTPDAFACPRLLKNGDPCSVSETILYPTAGCKECIGDAWEYVSSPLPTCVCRTGSWTCSDVPPTTIGDCVHMAPFNCPEVQNLYTDVTCVVHPPCGP